MFPELSAVLGNHQPLFKMLLTWITPANSRYFLATCRAQAGRTGLLPSEGSWDNSTDPL